jgi:hypothetical protein
MIGPKGVPCHQLAPRDDHASSSRSNPQAKIERLNTELARATRDRALDAICIGKLKGQLKQSEATDQNYEQMIDHMLQERNEAWHREDVARDHVEELEFYVNDLEGDNQIIHEEVYQLYYQLHPPPSAAEFDPGVILADGGESKDESKEEEDPEEIELVDESDDEGGHVLGMDTDHED